MIAPISIAGNQLNSWEATFADRDKYGSVQASFHNKQTAEKETIKVGDAQPVYTLRHTYDSADQARQNASAALEHLKRGTGTLNISLPGDTRLMSEGKITLSGIRDLRDLVSSIKTMQRNLSTNRRALLDHHWRTSAADCSHCSQIRTLHPQINKRKPMLT